MEKRNKTGMIISLIFSISAFLLMLYALFTPTSLEYLTVEAWFGAVFVFSAMLFSILTFSAKTAIPISLMVLSIILGGIMVLLMGLYWILICLVVCLIGCVVYKAGRIA